MSEINVTTNGLLLHATEFLIAAETLLNKAADIQYNMQYPIFYLFGHSIELSLKAFLFSSGMTANELKKIGHDISKLFVEAQTRNIQSLVEFNCIDIGVIQLLNIDYSSKKFEYRDSGGTYYLPNIAVTEEIARKLVIGLQIVCVKEG
ncbi:hypothetical protein [Methylomonas sp. AM2-LC]|jgi:hypothetical protein|uniref:hypothetical protein n=1 Tax=Methylomonas sp. AM2-LC TaxID=3153301 RepID=UPI0032674E08